MKIKPNILIFLSILFIGCENKEYPIVGSYETYKPTFIDRAFRTVKYDSWTVGTSLKINRDSTFTLVNCSMTLNGNWTRVDDSLYLNVVDKKFRIDSLNYSPKWEPYLKINSIPIGYKVKRDFLEAIHKDKKGRKNLEKLIKRM